MKKLLCVALLGLMPSLTFADCKFDTENQNKLKAKESYEKAKLLSQLGHLKQAVTELSKAIRHFSKIENDGKIKIYKDCQIYRYGVNTAYKESQRQMESYDYDYYSLMRELNIGQSSSPVVIVQFVADTHGLGSGKHEDADGYHVSAEIKNAGVTTLEDFSITVRNSSGHKISSEQKTLKAKEWQQSPQMGHIGSPKGVTISSHEKYGLNMYEVEQ